MGAPYDPKAVANYFLKKARKSGRSLTQMKLYKLVYLAHGFHLAILDTPLINEMIEAWEYGPVVPTLYQEFRRFGSRKITSKAKRFNPETFKKEPVPLIPKRSNAAQCVDYTWKLYKNYSALELSRLTHLTGSPWFETVTEFKGIMNPDIPNDKIKDYFWKSINR